MYTFQEIVLNILEEVEVLPTKRQIFTEKKEN